MAKKVDIYVGDRVRRTRLFRQMSQSDLAALITVSVEMLDRYESGAERFPSPALFRVAQALDVGPAFFFSGVRCGDLDAFDAAAIEAWSTAPYSQRGASRVKNKTFSWKVIPGGRAMSSA